MIGQWWFLWALAITFAYAEEPSIQPTPSTCASQANNTLTTEKPVFPKLIPRLAPSKHELETMFISAEGANVQREESLLVDVRTEKETQDLWIPGALRIPLEFLPNNFFVKKEKKLLVIGNGKNDLTLIQAAKALTVTSQGQFRIIQGGLPAWRRAEGELAGNAMVLDQPLLLSVTEFHALLMQGAIILSLDTQPPNQIQRPAPSWVVLSLKKSPVSQLKKLAKRFPSRFSPIVLLLPSEAYISNWRAAWNDQFQQEPVIFVDVNQLYSTYLDQQQQLAAQANKPLQHRCDRF